MKLLKNAKIIDYENNKFKDVHILLQEEKIDKIYLKTEGIPKLEDKDIIDCENMIVMPGFINSQSNLLKSFYYNNSKNLSLESFEENYEKFLSSLSDEQKYSIYKYQILNAIKNGITTICDEDLYNLALKKAVIETKINCVYKLGFNFSSDSLNENNIKKLKIFNENYIFSLKNVLFNSEGNFLNIIKYSKLYNKPALINGAESLLMAGDIEKEFSATNTQLLENYGFLDIKNIINNSNVLDKQEYDILSNYNSSLIYSPSFNFNFGLKSANLYSLNKQNLLGISSFNNDYFLELFLTRNLEKEGYNNLEIFSDNELLNFATINNAKILGIENRGEIKEGNFADLIIVNNSNGNINSLIKNFDNRNIKSVIINGELIYNNSHFLDNKDYFKLENNLKNITK